MRLLRFLLLAALLPLAAARASAQTYDACYVPSVGAIYLIKQAGLPTACLAQAHVPFAWISSGPLADGAVTTAKLADGAVTEAKLGFDPATQAELDAAMGRISGYQIVTANALVSPGQRNGLLATCPAGKAAIGGGYFAQLLQIEQSSPNISPAGSSWAVTAFNASTLERDFFAYAVCVNTS